MTILVYGLGRSGLATVRLLRRQGKQVQFFEAREAGPDISEAELLGARRLHDVRRTEARLAIVAPGVPIDHPDLNSLQAAGVEIIGEVEWVSRTFSNPLLGITGTAGKGTVTAWITHVLNEAGTRAVAGGNIDPALAEVADQQSVLVAELSSFQLERSTGLDPLVAVVLNLGEDHLDRHGTVDAYHAAKRNLLNRLSADHLFVYNQDDDVLRSWQQQRQGRSAGFSVSGPADAWLDGDTLLLHGQELIKAFELPLKGDHNIANALATSLACFELGLTHEAIATGLRTFRGLPGRFSTVGTYLGITFIEDSIATRPLAVHAALKASPTPLVWIAGGQNKGADIRQFSEVARERVGLFIGIGASGGEFCDGLRDVVPVLHCPEADGRLALRRALRAAGQHLHAHSARGGTVLLAPLAASFDQFSDYRERARVFREEVLLLEESWTPSS